MTVLSPRILIALVFVAAFNSACGGDSPIAPTPTAPVVQGIWTGDYAVSSCTFSGAGDACGTAGFGTGRVLPIRIVLNQNSMQLSGSVELGSLNIPVAGTITATGRMVLSGSANMPVNGVPATFSISNWDTVATPTTMTGQWRTTVAPTGVAGTMFIDSALRVMTKTG